MLFLNDEKIDAQSLCQKFGIDYQKLTKNPVFKSGKNNTFKDRFTGQTKTNEGTKMRSRIAVRQPNGHVDIIQYAESANPKEVGSKSIIEYLPRYVGFKGTTFNLRNNIDLAVFLSISPLNGASPTRGKGVKDEYLRTYDPQKEAIAELAQLDDLEKALIHSSKVDISDGRTLLKAIRKSLKVDDLVDEEVRVELRKIAHKEPKNYIGYINNKAMIFEGRIRDLIDKQAIVMKASNGVRQWVWAKGEKAGDFIGGQISNPREDAKAYIIKHILHNPEQYAKDIMSEQSTEEAHNVANSYFDSLELTSNKEKDVTNDFIVDNNILGLKSDFPEPTNESCKAWMKDNGYKMVTSHVKTLREGIESGAITGANIVMFAANNFEKAQ